MEFKRPDDHGGYFRLWDSLVDLIPWGEARALLRGDPGAATAAEEIHGKADFFADVDPDDWKSGAGEFAKYCRAFFRTDLYGLMRFGLSHGDRWHHAKNCRWLDEPWLFDKIRRFDDLRLKGLLHGIWLNWSRRHFKTTTAQGMCIQLLLQDPDVVVFYFSRTVELAQARIGDIRLELESNPLLQQLFPEILYQPDDFKDRRRAMQQWDANGFTVKRHGRSRMASAVPTISAYGVTGGLPTGGGANVEVFDDVEDDANAHTAAMIEKTVRQVEQAIKIADPSKPPLRLFLGTQYNASGPQARLQERGFITQAWNESAVDWNRPREEYGPHGLDIGGHEPILLTPEELKEFRGRGEEPWRNYCLQFLCRVDLARAQALDSRRMGTYDTPPTSLAGGIYYILMDTGGTPGSSPDSKLDDTAIWVVHLGGDSMIRIVDGELDLMDMPARGRHIMRLHRKWSARAYVHEVRIEESGAGGDCAYIAQLQNQQNYLFPVIRIAWGGAHTLSKKEREYEYISSVIDQLLTPGGLRRSRRGQKIDIIANLRLQMDTLVETSDDHPLDALALLGIPPGKNAMRYRGGRQPEQIQVQPLHWPGKHELPMRHRERRLSETVSADSAWFLSVMGVGDLPAEDFLL